MSHSLTIIATIINIIILITIVGILFPSSQPESRRVTWSQVVKVRTDDSVPSFYLDLFRPLVSYHCSYSYFLWVRHISSLVYICLTILSSSQSVNHYLLRIIITVIFLLLIIIINIIICVLLLLLLFLLPSHLINSSSFWFASTYMSNFPTRYIIKFIQENVLMSLAEIKGSNQSSCYYYNYNHYY